MIIRNVDTGIFVAILEGKRRVSSAVILEVLDTLWAESTTAVKDLSATAYAGQPIMLLADTPTMGM